MQFFTSPSAPNRVQLELGGLLGPFVQDGPLGAFDPRRDLSLFIDGVPTPVVTASFDAPNNRYLMFTDKPFSPLSTIQVVHHMPSPPFQAAAPPLRQHVSFLTTGITSPPGHQFAFPLPVTEGNALAVAVDSNNSTSVPTISDNLGSIWTSLGHFVGGGDSHGFTVFSATAPVSGDLSVTLKFSDTTDAAVVLAEMQHVLPLEQAVSSSGSSMFWTSPPLMPVSPKEFLVAFDVGYSPPVTITDSFQSIESQLLLGVPNVQLDLATLLVSSVGTYRSHFTQQGSDKWQTFLLSYPVDLTSFSVPGFALIAIQGGEVGGVAPGWGVGWGENWGTGN
jgi:hypothetical protein